MSTTPLLSASALTAGLASRGTRRRRVSDRVNPASSPSSVILPLIRSTVPLSLIFSKTSPRAVPSNSRCSGPAPAPLILSDTSRRIAGLRFATPPAETGGREGGDDTPARSPRA